MKSTTIWTAVAAFSIIIGVSSFSVYHQYKGDILSQETKPVVDTENKGITIKDDTLTSEESDIADTLDVSKEKALHKDDKKDLPEYLKLEQTEMYNTIHTNISLRIKENQAIGSIDFSKAYTEEKSTEQIIKEISQNIIFIGNGEKCGISATLLEKDKNMEPTMVPSKTHHFELIVECKGKIESASVSNTLFATENAKPSHFVNLYTQKRSNIQSIASGLITDLVPTVEWNTKNVMDPKDSDTDGLKDEEEKLYKTNALMIDTDGDGDSDYKEIEHGTNPLVPHNR